MKVLNMTAALILGGAIASPAMADDTYYDTARVLSVAPQTERVNMPRQECHTEYVQESASSGSRDIGGSIIGGIAGGLIGSQIGKGKGRIAGAAVGAATGAIVGDRIDNRDRDQDATYSSRPVDRCVTVDNWQTVNRGYLVTYRYNGRTYTTPMANDPGDTISLRVAIVPEANPNVSYIERHDNGLHRGWERHRDDDRWND